MPSRPALQARGRDGGSALATLAPRPQAPTRHARVLAVRIAADGERATGRDGHIKDRRQPLEDLRAAGDEGARGRFGRAVSREPRGTRRALEVSRQALESAWQQQGSRLRKCGTRSGGAQPAGATRPKELPHGARRPGPHALERGSPPHARRKAHLLGLAQDLEDVAFVQRLLRAEMLGELLDEFRSDWPREPGGRGERGQRGGEGQPEQAGCRARPCSRPRCGSHSRAMHAQQRAHETAHKTNAALQEGEAGPRVPGPVVRVLDNNRLDVHPLRDGQRLVALRLDRLTRGVGGRWMGGAAGSGGGGADGRRTNRALEGVCTRPSKANGRIKRSTTTQ